MRVLALAADPLRASSVHVPETRALAAWDAALHFLRSILVEGVGLVAVSAEASGARPHVDAVQAASQVAPCAKQSILVGLSRLCLQRIERL